MKAPVKARNRSLLAVTVMLAALGPLAGCGTAGPLATPSPGALIDRAHEVADEAVVAAATTALQALQASGRITEDAVRAALEKAGGVDVETRDLGDEVLFGAAVAGGCVSGSIGGTGPLSIELTAPNAEGGCLPAG